MKLVIITDHYPYTRGELPFLLPELAVTAPRFTIEIICKSPEEKPELEAPYKIPVKHYVQSLSQADKLENVAGCVWDPAYYREIFHNKSPLYPVWSKEAEVRHFRLAAHKFRAFMEAEGYFNHIEDTIFYSYWNNYAAYALALQKKKMPKMKIITRTHGYDLYHDRAACGRQLFKKDTDRQMNAVFFVSRQGRDYYMRHFATQSEDHYHMAYLGVPDNGLSPVGEGSGLCLFSCSNMIPIKRIRLIVEALARISDIPIRWVHAGGGPLEEETRALANRLLGEKQNISYSFLGSVPNDTIIDFYKKNAVDLFITTSQTEGGTPVSIMESLSFGVPVIGTNVGGIPEMVKPGTGFLLSQNPEAGDIAAAVLQYYTLPENEKRQMKANARELWQQSFFDRTNHEKFAAELLNL